MPSGTAPVEQNLKAAPPGFNNPERHPCWPWRVVSHFHRWLDFGQAIQPDSCILDCHTSIEAQESPLIGHGPAQDDDGEVCLFAPCLSDVF